MPWGVAAAAVGAVGSLASGAMSSGAASDAAATQAAAADRAAANQMAQYQQTRTDLAPYRDAGGGALAALNYGLGIGGYPGQGGTPARAAVPASAGSLPPGAQIVSTQDNNFFNSLDGAWNNTPGAVNVVDANGQVIKTFPAGTTNDQVMASFGSTAGSPAVDAVPGAPPPAGYGALNGLDPRYLNQSETILGQTPGYLGQAQGFVNQANGLLDQSNNVLGYGLGYLGQQDQFARQAQGQFDAAAQIGQGPNGQAALEATPGYQFSLQQGLRAAQNSAAARGLGVSGAALKGASTFATGLADKTYLDQYNVAVNNAKNTQSTAGQFGNMAGTAGSLAAGKYNLAAGSQNLAGTELNAANINNSTAGGYRDLNAANQGNITNQYNRLMGLTQLGQNSAAITGSQGLQATNAANQFATSGANALAAGDVGSAKAITSGLNGAANAFQQYAANNLVQQQNGGSGSQNWLNGYQVSQQAPNGLYYGTGGSYNPVTDEGVYSV